MLLWFPRMRQIEWSANLSSVPCILTKEHLGMLGSFPFRGTISQPRGPSGHAGRGEREIHPLALQAGACFCVEQPANTVRVVGRVPFGGRYKWQVLDVNGGTEGSTTRGKPALRKAGALAKGLQGRPYRWQGNRDTL